MQTKVHFNPISSLYQGSFSAKSDDSPSQLTILNSSKLLRKSNKYWNGNREREREREGAFIGLKAPKLFSLNVSKYRMHISNTNRIKNMHEVIQFIYISDRTLIEDMHAFFRCFLYLCSPMFRNSIEANNLT